MISTAQAAQLAAEYAASHARSEARYVALKLQTGYLTNRKLVSGPASGGTLTATRAIQNVGNGAGTFDTTVAEVPVIASASNAQLRYMTGLAVTLGTGTDARLDVPGAGAPVLDAGVLPDADDALVVAGQLFAKLSVRGGGPDPSVGVQIVTPGASGRDARLQVQIQETTVQASTPGGTINYKPAVEWVVMTSLAADCQIFDSGGTLVHTLQDPVRTFTGLVGVGDFVRLAANGTTTDPAVDGKFFQVLAVGTGTLQLTTKAYTKMPDGTYIAQAADQAMYHSSYDYSVMRVRTEQVFLRDTTRSFAGVRAGDWLHAHWTDTLTAQVFDKVFPVVEVPSPGLVLLSLTAYQGARAPYGTPMVVTPGDYFSEPAIYGMTRAPGTLAYFHLIDPAASFAGNMAVGDFVRFLPRGGPLDPTASPGVVAGAPGYHRVASLISGTQLAFDQMVYTLVGGQFVADQNLYVDLDTFCDYQRYSVATTFPHASLYKVTDISRNAGQVVSYDLERAFYAGYGGLNGAYTARPDAVPAIDDFYDVELIQVYPNQLLLYQAGANLSRVHAPTPTSTDFVHVKGRTAAPATANPIVTIGSFVATGVPRPDVILLAPTRYSGVQPRYTAGAAFPAGSYQDACDFSASRVGVTFSLVEIAGAPGPIAAGDYLGLIMGPPEVLGTWLVNAVETTRVVLDPLHQYTRTPAQDFVPVAIDPGDLTNVQASASYAISRKLPGVGALTFEAGVAWPGVIGATPPGLGTTVTSGFVLATNHGPANARITRHFLVSAVAGQVLTLDPVPLSVDAKGTYTRGTDTEGTPGVTTAVDYQLYQITGAYTDVNDQLDYLRASVIPATRQAQIDPVYTSLVAPGDPGSARDVVFAAVNQAVTLLGGAIDVDLPDLPPFLGGAIAASVVLDGLSDVRTTAAIAKGTLQQLDLYQQALAFACAADFAGAFEGKTLSALKDAYVDASLTTQGYADWLAFIGTSTDPAGQAGRSGVRAQALAGQAVAQKYMDAVTTALATRNRSDLSASITSQLANLVALVKSDVLPDPYPNPMRFFIQPATVAVKSDFVAQLLTLTFIPGFTLGRLKDATTNADPRPRRDALKGMIGVPADSSLAAKRRQYALARNQVNYLNQVGTDLQRHIDTATDPGLKAGMQGFMSGITDQIAGAADQAQSIVADVGDELALTFQELDVAVDPGDAQAVALAAEPLESYESEGLLPLTQVAPSEAAAAINAATTVETQNTAPAVTSPEERLIITNLFTNDFNDFRKTGIVVGLDSFEADVTDPSNRNELASMYLTDLEDNIVLGFDLRGSNAGTFTGERYNQFMLMAVQESYADKFQIQDTLGDGFLMSTFGERPEVWSISGALINDVYSDQVSKFRELWQNFIRATKLAKGKRKLAIDVPAAGMLVMCYPVNLTMTTDAQQNEKIVPFAMQIVVSRTYRKPLINLATDDEKKIAQALSDIPVGGNLQSALAANQSDAALASQKAQDQSLVHKLQMAASNASGPVAKAAAAAKLADPARQLSSLTQEIEQRALPFPL